MKRFSLFLVAAALALAFCAQGQTSDCHRPAAIVHQSPTVYAAPVVHQAAYVAPVYAAQFLAVPIVVPAYSTGYDQGYATTIEISRLRAELDSMRQVIQPQQFAPQIQQGQAPSIQAAPQQALPPVNAAPPQTQPPPLGAPPQMSRADQPGQPPTFLRAKCASCHEASVANAKGDGFVLFQGQNIVQLSGDDRTNILTEVYLKHMPKNGSTTDEEVGELVAYFNSLKKVRQ